MNTTQKWRVASFGLALLLAPACSHKAATADGQLGRDTRGADLAATTDTLIPDTSALDQKAVEDAAADTSLVDTLTPNDLPSGCDASKIKFTRANPAKYELWELCFSANDRATEAAIKAIDASASCRHSAGGAFAKCASASWRCMAALDRDPTSKAVTAAAWKKLCQLSVLPAVSKIVGGHYL